MYKSDKVLYRYFFHGLLDSKEVNQEELGLLQKKWKEAKAATWYYQGSKEEYDYLVFFDFDLSKKRDTVEKYRIKKGYLKLLKTFPLTNRRKKWRILPWGPKKHLRGV